MTILAASSDSRGFFAFYREYAQTGIHAATAAALTGFIGLASFISPWFLAVAIGVYALPPIYFYLNEDIDPIPNSEASSAETPTAKADSNSDATSTDEPARNPEPAATAADADSPRADRSDTEAGGEAEPGSDHTKTETSAEAETGSRTETDSETGAAVAEPEADAGTDSDVDTETEEAESDAAPEFETEWVEVDSPVNVALRDAVASGEGAYVAGDGGVVLARREEWEVLLDDGPAGDSNTLWGIDCTANAGGQGNDGGDGEAVLWVAGDSGVVGRYDPAVGGIADFSAPKDQTSSWTGLAVTGSAGEETVHLANGSGAVIRGEYDEAEGSIEWDELDKPGSGSSITAITFRDSEVGYLCDSSGGVYRTEDGGGSYEAIGPEESGVAFCGLAPIGSEGLLVAGEDGSLFQYDGSAWTRRSVSEVPLRAIDTTASDSIDLQGVAGDGAGAIYEYDGSEWTPTETAVGSIVAVAIEESAFAIGDGGEITERERTRKA